MSNQIYNWKRFWCPREGVLDLSDGGYLREPSSEWAKYYSSNLVEFEDLLDIPCLILLGEPGIGKSHVMGAEKENLDKAIVDQGEKTFWLNLRAYGDENRLVRDLFETPEFSSWLDGTHTLHIFLDSLDECLLQMKYVAELLVDKLSKYPTDRLHLRIACRTADLPGGLENDLKSLWGEEAVKAYKLAPLTRDNVVDAASENGLPADDFLGKIDRMNAVSLAIKPITLKFLITTYRSGRFPRTQTELYREGCRLFCEETNLGRRARLTGALDADQRMVVAARIAAITMFCNRNAIWTDIDYGDMPDEDVGIQALCGGTEYTDSGHFKVTKAEIQETLSTGLFSSLNMQSMGWAHQTYAEYLAAWYLEHRQMTVPQMLSLLMHSGELGRSLVPQLHETSAWLAGMVPDVFQEIMQVSPEVLLRSDVATVDVEDRIVLIDTLLKLFDEERLLDRDWGIRENYKKLKHPGLAEQLRPYILDKDKGILVRRVAADIAEACELLEVQEDLLKVVFDVAEPYEVRVNVAWALLRIADESTKAKLRPLAFGRAGADPEDDLKGIGLLATWPNHLSVVELFAFLIHPKRDSYSGAYRRFLNSDFVEHIGADELPVALRWTEKLSPRHQLRFSFENLMDAIFWKAWLHLDELGILDPFAKAIWVRLQNYDDLFGSNQNSALAKELREDDKKRRLLIEAIVSILVATQEAQISFRFSRPPFILTEDVLWMLEQLQTTESEKTRCIWAQFIGRVYNEQDVTQQSAVYDTYRNFPVLEREFAWFFGSIALDSPKAQRLQDRYAKERELAEKQARREKSLGPPVREWVQDLLGRFELGDLDAWWQLTLDTGFAIDTHSKSYREYDPDLTNHPGWQTTDDETRARIVLTARKYIADYVIQDFDWVATRTHFRPAVAGYKALWLLIQENYSSVSEIPVDVWKKWVPAIVDSKVSGGSSEIHQALVKAAYAVSPDEVIDILMRLIDFGNADEGLDCAHIIQGVKACLDDRLAEALLCKAKDSSLRPVCARSLLMTLLEQKVKAARTFAESLIHVPILNDSDVQSKAVFAARALMDFTKDAGWPVIWPVIQKDAEFGSKLFLTVADGPNRYSPAIAQKLSESQIADLYVWLSRHFPHNEDPNPQGVHSVTPRESLATWRRGLLDYLQQKGTVEACMAIQRIAQALPGLSWMKWVLLRAESTTRRKSWEPPKPEAILSMVRDHPVTTIPPAGNITIVGDGNVIGSNNQVSVNKSGI